MLAGAEVILVAEATQRVNLPADSIGTLLRQGALQAVPAPDRTRHRYVTLASVQGFAATRQVPRPSPATWSQRWPLSAASGRHPADDDPAGQHPAAMRDDGPAKPLAFHVCAPVGLPRAAITRGQV